MRRLAAPRRVQRCRNRRVLVAVLMCGLLPQDVLADARDIAVVSAGSSDVSIVAADRVASDLAARGSRVAPDPDGRLRGPVADAPRLAADDGTARDAYDSAREAYSRFAFDVARRQLARFDSAAAGMDPRDAAARRLIADRYLLSGLIHLGEDRADRAVRDFRGAWRIYPERDALDPGAFRPQVVELYRRAQGPDSDDTVAVEIDVSAADASVMVGGDDHSGADRVRVEPGPHIALVRAPGHADRAALVVAAPQARWRFDLEELGAGSLWRQRRRRAEQSAAAMADLARAVERDTGAAAVVITRSRRGRAVGAIYTAGERTTEWLPVPSERLYAALSGSPAPARDLGLSASGRRDEDPSPWYRRWWGTGLLVGGGALVAGAVMYTVLTPESEEPAVGLGMWCVEGETCAR